MISTGTIIIPIVNNPYGTPVILGEQCKFKDSGTTDAFSFFSVTFNNLVTFFGRKSEFKDNFAVQSCCGGKGNIRWSDTNKQWSCTDCGSVKSNDPSYYWTPRASTPIDPNDLFKSPQWLTPQAPKCECGGTKANTTHAFWCTVKN